MESTVTVESKTGESARDRRRVLLLAYACSPYSGSDARVGWACASEIAKYFETWVICKQQRYEEDLRLYFAEHGNVPGLHFCFIPRTRLETFLKKIPGFTYLAHNSWHRRAYREAIKLHNEFRFDIAHQVTFCGFREPGYLWKLDIPFIWGPVGGTQNYPWRFLIQAGFSGLLIEGLRSVMNLVQFRFAPRVRKAARRATALLVANSLGKCDFETVHKVVTIQLLDVGTHTVADRRTRLSRKDRTIRILWSGVLEHRKALHLLIMALGNVPSSCHYELRILGEGPLENRWRKLSCQLRVEQHSQWMKWLPHKEAMAQYGWADIFIFTSLRDTCGTVVLESLSHGVPLICLAHQGAGDVVTEKCGITIPVTTPSQVVLKLRDAIVWLAEDRSRLEDLSRGAIQRAGEYLWSRKGERIAKIYDEVIGVKEVRNPKREEIHGDACRRY